MAVSGKVSTIDNSRARVLSELIQNRVDCEPYASEFTRHPMNVTPKGAQLNRTINSGCYGFIIHASGHLYVTVSFGPSSFLEQMILHLLHFLRKFYVVLDFFSVKSTGHQKVVTFNKNTVR